MECSRCGGEAVVKRDNAVYCGKCALARDWQEIIHVVQQDRVSLSKPAAQPPASKPAGGPPADSIAMDAAAEAEAEPQPTPEPAPAPAQPDAAKADPFA